MFYDPGTQPSIGSDQYESINNEMKAMVLVVLVVQVVQVVWWFWWFWRFLSDGFLRRPEWTVKGPHSSQFKEASNQLGH